MLKSSEVLKNRKELLEKRLVKHTARVNEEMLAIEKCINKYNKDIDDTKNYIDIDMIITTDESKQALKEAEWVIDKSQSVPCGHTWIRPVESSYARVITKINDKFEKEAEKHKPHTDINPDEVCDYLCKLFC